MRKDGVRVKDADPMYTVAPYIMDKRYDAMNMITLDIPAEPMRLIARTAKVSALRERNAALLAPEGEVEQYHRRNDDEKDIE